ncbi:MAG: ketopantoate reductase family protein [Phycisphaeraceae bacterium]|nr:ketopantoate reductase family protein [Phycisphaeraceae bacterium]MCW5762899.1 ketopantoate reductase family protein [Phycisphaeraceae bacterium]
MNAGAMDFDREKIGVIGAGAMGVCLAAVLGQSVPVVIVARSPERAEQLKRHGAVVCGLGNVQSRPLVVSDIASLARCGSFSAIFIATKTTSIDAVSESIRPLLGDLGGSYGAPFIVSFQNGIGPGLMLSRRLMHDRVLRMVLHYGARLTPSGAAQVIHTSVPHAIGGPDATHLWAAQTLGRMLTLGGMETIAVESIEPLAWKKGIINAAMNPVAALTDSSVGEVLDSPARSIVVSLVTEGLAVAAAQVIDLGPNAEADIWRVFESAREHTPSMVEDIRLGRLTEVGQLNRQVIEHAEGCGVAVPGHRMIASLIDAFDWRVFRRSPRYTPSSNRGTEASHAQ